MDPGFLAPVIAIVVVTVTAGAVLILRGPLGKALGDRLAGRRAAEGDDAGSGMREVRDELEEVRGQLAELQERMDYAERLLVRTRDPELPGRAGQA